MNNSEPICNSHETVNQCSESFWEIGQYKKVVRRVDDGLKLCSELVQMLRERGEIESSYGKMLHGWSKKWNGLIEKGAEYGSTQSAWQSVADEARSLADLHLVVRDRLNEEVCDVLKLWSKDNFHRNAFGTVKESKEVDDSFKKAQKSWTKLYGKVARCRRDYFNASRQERTAINQEKNASSNAEISAEQVKKFTEKVVKSKEERELAESAYKKSLKDLNEYKPRYEEDMIQVFKRYQEMEMKRLKFFKEMFQGVHLCLDLSREPNLKTIYSNMRSIIDSMDGRKDVEFWEKYNGPGMAMAWPVFEPYTPEVREIMKKRPSSKCAESVTLISQRLSVAEPNGSALENAKSTNDSAVSDGGRVLSSSTDKSGLADSTNDSPFDDEWDESDVGKAGVLVRALYDYEKQEDDELSFKKGEVFEKLEDEDEQGWCKGRKDGVTGLYPANYALVHAADAQ